MRRVLSSSGSKVNCREADAASPSSPARRASERTRARWSPRDPCSAWAVARSRGLCAVASDRVRLRVIDDCPARSAYRTVRVSARQVCRSSRRRAPSCSVRWVRAARWRAASDSSWPKRCSASTVRGGAPGATRVGSMPAARSRSSRPEAAPRMRWRVSSGVAAIRSAVRRPYEARVRAVAGPTPGSAAAGSPVRNRVTASGSSGTVRMAPGSPGGRRAGRGAGWGRCRPSRRGRGAPPRASGSGPRARRRRGRSSGCSRIRRPGPRPGAGPGRPG